MSDEKVKVNQGNLSPLDKAKKQLDIQVVTVSDLQPGVTKAKRSIVSSGKVLTPPNHVYVGSAVVHYYQKAIDDKTVVFITCTPFDKSLNELQAALGLSELKKKLMASFGRKPTGV